MPGPVCRHTGAVADLHVRLDRALDQAGVHGAIARDGLLAVVVAAASAGLVVAGLGPLAEIVGVTLAGGQRHAVVVVVVLQALILALRRLRPVGCLLLVVGAQVALAAVLPDQTTVRLVAPLVAVYGVGTVLPARRVVGWVGTAVVLEAAGGAIAGVAVGPTLRPLLGGDLGRSPLVATSALVWVLGAAVLALGYLLAALAGVLAASRRPNLRLVADQADAALRAQAARHDLAARAERSRMARELHDIAAHHLSGLVVQAAAAERLVDIDATTAKDAVRSIRAQGKEALANLRLVVGVLRERVDGPDSDVVAGLGLDGFGRLVDDARRLGNEVSVEVAGEPYALTPLADVTAYRVLLSR